ncbi:hypothetical protein Pan153_10820 [Gimesia panareensis]|uniref:DUF4279 domain-containing protein n=1 Tax=Gimesia panareensis TaxID=2527978 RepID=A0A518FJI3_9PLAN|nr:hypothetical protein Pan153_10820 [Gimesia panareensis]
MCVLRLSGPHQKLSASVSNSFIEFREAIASQKDRESGKTTEGESSTYLYSVSNADNDHVPTQISDAVNFLTQRQTELKELLSRDGVEQAILDFAWDFPLDALGQFNRFPLSLIDLCAKLGIEIEVSVYGTSTEKKQK